MPHWYIVNEDDGIVRREPTLGALVRWALIAYDGWVLPGKKRVRDGHYRYAIGEDRDNHLLVSVFRRDVLAHAAYDLAQEPLYPYPDDPWQLGPRGSGGHADDEQED
ncbi:hypothetical protein GCM10022224_104510 [Nonomuraea antimicrobica]|uniref:Uncharacterized protein n=1 Tax=Nonomuraea antimicrobica TaxID=561173 RepID=A0ABP7ESB2_9ACTN